MTINRPFTPGYSASINEYRDLIACISCAGYNLGLKRDSLYTMAGIGYIS